LWVRIVDTSFVLNVLLVQYVGFTCFLGLLRGFLIFILSLSTFRCNDRRLGSAHFHFVHHVKLGILFNHELLSQVKVLIQDLLYRHHELIVEAVLFSHELEEGFLSEFIAANHQRNAHEDTLLLDVSILNLRNVLAKELDRSQLNQRTLLLLDDLSVRDPLLCVPVRRGDRNSLVLHLDDLTDD